MIVFGTSFVFLLAWPMQSIYSFRVGQPFSGPGSSFSCMLSCRVLFWVQCPDDTKKRKIINNLVVIGLLFISTAHAVFRNSLPIATSKYLLGYSHARVVISWPRAYFNYPGLCVRGPITPSGKGPSN